MGKTSTAVQFPKALLLGFEKGYNALGGIMVKKITSWYDFKEALDELPLDAVRAKFQTIIIDTADIAWDYCVSYICKKHGVSELGEIAWGKGYAEAENEYAKAFQLIPQLDYGLVMVSHDQDKTEKDENGIETSRIIPTLDKRARKIVLRMTDINGYARITGKVDADGFNQDETMLYLRGTTRFEAGSRWKYMPNKIVLSYDNLVNAINEAIDGEEKDGIKVVDTYENQYGAIEKEESFEDFRSNLLANCASLAELDERNGLILKAIIAKHLTVSLSDANEDQYERLKIIALDIAKNKSLTRE